MIQSFIYEIKKQNNVPHLYDLFMIQIMFMVMNQIKLRKTIYQDNN